MRGGGWWKAIPPQLCRRSVSQPPLGRDFMSAPGLHPYQQALDHLRREGTEPPLKRMSELISLLELTTTLSSDAAGEESLNAALGIVMAETQAETGALFMRGDDDTFVLLSSRGLPRGAPSTLVLETLPDDLINLGPGDDTHERHGFVLLCPIHRRGRPMAVLGLGSRAGGLAYGAEEHTFLRSVAACAAIPIEN